MNCPFCDGPEPCSESFCLSCKQADTRKALGDQKQQGNGAPAGADQKAIDTLAQLSPLAYQKRRLQEAKALRIPVRRSTSSCGKPKRGLRIAAPSCHTGKLSHGIRPSIRANYLLTSTRRSGGMSSYRKALALRWRYGRCMPGQ